MLHSRPSTLNSTLMDHLIGYSGTSFNSSTRTPQKTRVTCQTASSLVRYQHWNGSDEIENTASSIVACWTVFTEPLPGNTLIKSVTLCTRLHGVISQKKLIFIVTSMRNMRYLLVNHSLQRITLIRNTKTCRT
jgi:hypothetical protein